MRTRLSVKGDYQVVEVEDNGPGIPEEVLQKIFEPFYSTKGSKGTGLGLAVVQKVAEENDGTIEVKSTEGIGTTFTLKIPIKPHDE